MEDQELKPCPFCGGAAAKAEDSVCCTSCPAKMWDDGGGFQDDDINAAWNRRPAADKALPLEPPLSPVAIARALHFLRAASKELQTLRNNGVAVLLARAANASVAAVDELAQGMASINKEATDD